MQQGVLQKDIRWLCHCPSEGSCGKGSVPRGSLRDERAKRSGAKQSQAFLDYWTHCIASHFWLLFKYRRLLAQHPVDRALRALAMTIGAALSLPKRLCEQSLRNREKQSLICHPPIQSRILTERKIFCTVHRMRFPYFIFPSSNRKPIFLIFR